MGFERDVSPAILASIIRGVSGSTIATAFVETVPTMRKRGNPYWDLASKTWSIRKRSQITVIIGGTYSGAVNRSRLRVWTEGEAPQSFESQGRRWGHRMARIGSAKRRGVRASIVTYSGRLYLDVQRVRLLSVSYIGVDGVEIPAANLSQWLIAPRKSEHGVTWRDYPLTSIRQLRMQGNVFNLRLDVVASQAQRAA